MHLLHCPLKVGLLHQFAALLWYRRGMMLALTGLWSFYMLPGEMVTKFILLHCLSLRGGAALKAGTIGVWNIDYVLLLIPTTRLLFPWETLKHTLDWKNCLKHDSDSSKVVLHHVQPVNDYSHNLVPLSNMFDQSDIILHWRRHGDNCKRLLQCASSCTMASEEGGQLFFGNVTQISLFNGA